MSFSDKVFQPAYKGQTIAVTNSSAKTQIDTIKQEQVYLANYGDEGCYVKFAKLADAGSDPLTVDATTGYLIPSGSQQILSIAEGTNAVATLTVSGTTNLHLHYGFGK